MENYRDSVKQVLCFKLVRLLSICEAEFSSYTSTLLLVSLAKFSTSGLRRRKSPAFLIQCESRRTAEGRAITAILNRLHLLCLNFTPGLAAFDCVTSMGKTASDFSLRTSGRQCLLGLGHASDPLVFFPWQMFWIHSVHLHLVDWEREACQDTRSHPLWHDQPRAGHERVLCWIPHVQALVPTDN